MTRKMSILIGVPVYNEEKYLSIFLKKYFTKLSELRSRFPNTLFETLIVDDGSTDNSQRIYEEFSKKECIFYLRNDENQGYGSVQVQLFEFSINMGFDWLITIDADLQHDLTTLDHFLEEIIQHGNATDVFSGSRYLKILPNSTTNSIPIDRYLINMLITHFLNQITPFSLTDSFCGYKAYKVKSLERLQFKTSGYSFPMEFWMQAAKIPLKVKEVPTPAIYLTDRRSRGNWSYRLEQYIETLRTLCWSNQQIKMINSLFHMAITFLQRAENGALRISIQPHHDFVNTFFGENPQKIFKKGRMRDDNEQNKKINGSNRIDDKISPKTPKSRMEPRRNR